MFTTSSILTSSSHMVRDSTTTQTLPNFPITFYSNTRVCSLFLLLDASLYYYLVLKTIQSTFLVFVIQKARNTRNMCVTRTNLSCSSDSQLINNVSFINLKSCYKDKHKKEDMCILIMTENKETIYGHCTRGKAYKSW